MKIKMKTLLAGPTGTLQPGQVADLPDEEAKALIEGRYAEPVKDYSMEEVVSEVFEELENEMLDSNAKETTTNPRTGGSKSKARKA